MASFLRGAALSLCLVLPGAALALDPGIPLRQIVVDSWQASDGLPVNSATAVVQTADGYIWAATEEGLARFDGVRFEVFDVDRVAEFGTNLIQTLAEAKGGGLWIGTTEALLRMEKGRFTSYGNAEGLPRGTVQAIVEDREGTVWAGTDGGGLVSLHGGRLVPFTTREGLAVGSVRALLAARDGSLWVGTRNGLWRIRGKEVTTYRAAEGLPNPYVTSLWEARNGDLWIGTNGGGLARLAGDRFTVYGANGGLPVANVLAVREDRDGTLWAGTNGGGLCRLAGGRFECLTTRHGLPADLVYALEEDREGGLWAVTTGGGLARLREGHFLNWGKKDGLSGDIVLPILEDRDGAVWIGTAGAGLNRLSGGKVTTFGARDGLPHAVVLSLAPDPSGGLWIGTAGGGLTRWDGKRFVSLTMRDGLESNLVQAIVVARDGSVWAGTNGGGIAILRAGRISSLRTRDGLPTDTLVALLEGRDGTIWAGTTGGLVRISGGRVSPIEAPGLTGRSILSLHESSDGVVWVGTVGAGLQRVAGGRVSAVRKKDGLPDDAVGAILEDGADSFWMSSNKGVFRARRVDLDAVAEGRASHVRCVLYGTRDGMASAECNGGYTPAGWRGADGRLWFATNRGAVVVDPSRLRPDPPAPAARVETILVDGKAADPAKETLLPAGSRNLEVRFAAPTFTDPKSLQFRYRLEGFDPGWVEAGTRRAAYYTNLPPGRLRFHVASIGPNGGSGDEASVEIVVAAPFWKTPPFAFLCAAAAVAVAAALTRWHRNRERRRERDHASAHALLEKLVADRTAQLKAANDELEAFSYSVSHDLRAPLRAIDGFSAIVVGSYAASLDAEGHRLLGLVRESARRMSRLIDDLLDFSRSNRTEIRHTRLRMKAVAQAAFEEAVPDPAVRARIDFRLGELPDAEGDAALLGQVWLNILSNAVKFSAKAERPTVEVSGSVEGGFARYRVRDNGAGFDMAYADKLFGVFQRLHGVTEFEGTGVGLALVKRIVTRHGGSVSADGTVGGGATFSITLPVGPGPEGSSRPL